MFCDSMQIVVGEKLPKNGSAVTKACRPQY